MNYINLMIAVFLVGFLMIGGELYRVDQEQGTNIDIYNYTDKIVIPLSNISQNYPIEKTRGIINTGRLYKVVESGVNFLLVSAEQVSKMGIEYGYQHPEINFQVIWKYLVYILIIIIVVLLLKPIGYIIVFLIMLIIMIKERKKRKERKNG